jgi:hypothetical protein
MPKNKKMKAMTKRRTDDYPQLLRPPSLAEHVPSTLKLLVQSNTVKKGKAIDMALLSGPDWS